MFLVIEAGFVVVALVLAFILPDLGSSWFEAIERSFGKLARRRGLSVLTVGLAALALRAALLPILPVPVPGMTDEFGYLLLSDTFAHGRLTNPTSPMWAHFENAFIIWHPTHTAMYYPAQGLFMAAGQVLMGHPFWGVWLSLGLMCAAITWMLQVWVGEGWALLGGFLAVIRFGTFNYWANSYWGGAVAAIGGALVLGALPRMKPARKVRYALLMGLGFAILANSRPYEGLFFGIPVAVAMFAWLWKMKRPDFNRTLKRIMAPLLAVLALTLAGMGYYFGRTTGSPVTPPYLVYEHNYDPVPYFPWQRMKAFPHYRIPAIRNFYLAEEHSYYDPGRTLPGLIVSRSIRVAEIAGFFLGPVLLLPLLLLPAALPYGFSWRQISSGTKFLLAVTVAVIAANLLPTFYLPHYTAAVSCSILALVLLALRRLRVWQCRGKPAGVLVSRAVPSICVLMLLVRAAAPGLPTYGIPQWCTLTVSNKARAAVLRKLRQLPGKQLVIVHHNPQNDYGFDHWVYNRADLDSAKVIWAHDMGAAKNEELIRYFNHRRAWLLDVDDHPPKLLPYPQHADATPKAGGKPSG